MNEYRFHLQKYKPGSKTVCPGCGRKSCFTRYIDEAGEISFPGYVGKCDHIHSWLSLFPERILPGQSVSKGNIGWP